jgi:hypothetical protein
MKDEPCRRGNTLVFDEEEEIIFPLFLEFYVPHFISPLSLILSS